MIFSIWLKRIEPFLLPYDPKNWTFIEPFFNVWLKKIWTFFFLKYDSKELFFLLILLKEFWTSFFLIWLKELNPSLNMTQRIELFCENDSKNWTLFFLRRRELNRFLFDVTQRIDFFFTMTLRIEPFLKIPHSKNSHLLLILFICLKEWNPFLNFDSKTWTLLWIWLKELNPFWMWL